jgi:hypothetical protein
MSKTISAGRTPKIIIESIGGDLSLVGWDGDDILLKADDEEMRVNQDGEQVTVSCTDDLSLRAPKSASIFIGNIGGDASIRSLMGDIELKEIGGDLSLRDVYSISAGAVHADFSLRGAKGHLSVKSAHGDVSIRDVDGNVTLESIADDLALRDVRGNITANVAEDVVLYLNPNVGNTYSVTAGDDILLVMPPKANAALTLNADNIDVEWKGVEYDKEAASCVITLGDGSAAIALSAGGDIRVSNQADAGESAEDFGNFAGIGMDWSGFGDRISQRVNQATQRAQRKVEEAARRIEQKTREAERRANRGKFLEVGRWSWDLSQKGVPIPPRPSATDEERLAILKMLQDKKITAEEAEKLLSSLEGGL